MVMTPRCRYSPKARRSLRDYGHMCVTIGRLPGPIRRPQHSSTRAIAAASIPPGIWPVMPASCRPTRMPASADLYDGKRKPGPITEAACWSHSRAQILRTGRYLRKAPLTVEAVRRIDELFAIERTINGLSTKVLPQFEICEQDQRGRRRDS